MRAAAETAARTVARTVAPSRTASLGTQYSAKPLLTAVTLIPLLTFVTTYAISLNTPQHGEGAEGYVMEYPYFFLSTSIEAKPASNFGTFGLCLSCACVPLTAFIRHARVKFAAAAVADASARGRARALNTHALKVVVVAAVSGVGVASFQSTTDACGGTLWIIGVHLIFALTFFVGGMRYCMLQYKIDCLVPTLGTARERLLRKWFARATLFQLAMLGVLMVVAMILFISLTTTINTATAAEDPSNSSTTPSASPQPSSSQPQSSLPPTSEISDAVQAVIFVMSLFEISLLITFMSTFITFWDSFSTTKFSLVVMDTSREYTLHESQRGVIATSTTAAAAAEDGDKEKKRPSLAIEL